MRTLITLENSNCTRCHNGLLDVLREQEGVQRVRSDFSTGCLVIEHESDLDALVSLITTADRAVAVAGNGEREMVPVDAREAIECRLATDTLRAPRSEEEATPSSATGHVGNGHPPSATRSPSGTWPSHGGTSAASVPASAPAFDAIDEEGVCVLRRERPAPGLVLRVVRVLIRAFRVVFGITLEAR